jgi:hypothetical protein
MNEKPITHPLQFVLLHSWQHCIQVTQEQLLKIFQLDPLNLYKIQFIRYNLEIEVLNAV